MTPEQALQVLVYLISKKTECKQDEFIQANQAVEVLKKLLEPKNS